MHRGGSGAQGGSSAQGRSSHDTEKTDHVKGTQALMVCQAQREGQVRILKESDHTRGTHQLLSTKGGSNQKSERNSPYEGHALTVKCKGRVKSEHLKKQTVRQTLTNCRAHREGWPHMEGQMHRRVKCTGRVKRIGRVEHTGEGQAHREDQVRSLKNNRPHEGHQDKDKG